MKLEDLKLQAPKWTWRFFDIAYGQTSLCSGTCGRNRNSYRLGAAVFSGSGTLYGVGYNNYRTHPFLVKYTKFPIQHAESAAILDAGLWRCGKANIVVVRSLRDGSIANAKPCGICEQIMRDVGISDVFFSTDRGFGHVRFDN